MPFWWRVTRYDPSRRDARGVYRGNAWTSIADVGDTFEDGELTLERYLEVEDAYVETAVSFAEESRAKSVAVRGLEKGAGLRDGQLLSIADVRDVVRSMLREETICKLEEPDGHFAIHVGYDLYLYIGAARPCPTSTLKAVAAGLHVDEDLPSPYRDQR